MASTIDEITISYFEEGIEVVKELDKQILSKGAWTTMVFRYQEWDNKLQDYGPEKYSIRRYQKKSGEYKQRSKFNITNRSQAEKIIEILQNWLQHSTE